MMKSEIALASFLLHVGVSSERVKKPNVIFVLADDLGWGDVSWNNPDMPTSNMARLAAEGLRLEQSYAQQVCTPSRAALLTGMYPVRTGSRERPSFSQWRPRSHSPCRIFNRTGAERS